jgi:hypothetical protein
MALDVYVVRTADTHVCIHVANTMCLLQARLVCVIPTSILKPMDGMVSQLYQQRHPCMHQAQSASAEQLPSAA